MRTTLNKKTKSIQNKPQDFSQSFTALSGLAEELNAPLTSVSKRTQDLINEYKTKDFEYISFKDFKNIIQTLEQVNRQLKRCCDTTDRMIKLNKRKAQISTESCQINNVIKEVLDLAAQQLEFSKIKVNLRLAPNLPFARLGIIESHQVIDNVIVNAIQSMPGGGHIKIRTQADSTRKLIMIDVQDEGVGITPEHLSKVFEPFFTTKEYGIEKSSGLGLSIVYSIISNAGGFIDIKSSLRNGTHVTITLPIV